MSIRSLVAWLRECYREDRSRAGVRDFYGSDVMHRRMTRDEEKLLNDLLDSEHLPPHYAEKASAYAQLHSKERDLIYGALLVCGKFMGKVYRAPLIIVEAEFLHEDSSTGFSLKSGTWRLNPCAMELLDGNDGFEAELLQTLSSECLSHEVVGDIRRSIEVHCTGVETRHLLDWPYLVKSKQVEDAGRDSSITVLPACGLANVTKSVSARGVLNELGSMATYVDQAFSRPLRALYSGEQFKNKVDDTNALMVPTTLSIPQERILRSARSNALTVCYGPPGTGKSFTLAAIALDHVARGERVLVVSRGDHAVDVLHHKIDSMLEAGEATVRAGRKHYLRELKSYLELCLSGRTVDGIELVNLGQRELEIEEQIARIQKAERDLELEFAASISRGAVMAKPDKGWFDDLRNYLSKRSVSKRPLLAEMMMYLEQLHAEREKMVREYGRLERQCRLVKILDSPGSRKDLKSLLEGMRKLQGHRQEEIFKTIDFSLIYEALPIWLTKCDDLHRVLPLTREQFDVVIIDEASQCDLASVMPALQRAKRAVIAGDTKQLRHVSFVSENLLRQHAMKSSIDAETLESYHYRKRSLMDVACDQVYAADQTGFLDEHFRSHPSIISFSNERFYHDSLKLMREQPWVGSQDQLFGHRCRGVRGGDGVNQAEVHAIVKELRKIAQKEIMLPVHACCKVGVLSPFRAQVDAIMQAVQEELSSKELDRLMRGHQLAIGTAHQFQGEERDVMLISLCLTSACSQQTRRFLEREDVFNVSITRAKLLQRVYYSIDSSSLPLDSLLGDYLRHVSEESNSFLSDGSEAMVAFANEVAMRLQKLGAQVIQEGVVAGMDVDLVLIHRSKVLGIDLVGFPGAMVGAVAQRKAQMLGRAGLRMLPLGYVEWQSRTEDCLRLISGQLGLKLIS
ncbi:hypothetical protein Rhal01_00343 [Rubritalea halochordaticola]|uniref:AAA+ ATPase domain-containing protein n=1 Tax=Rubritalea halochordaticola TaxID=714537 RepID=A0ABP9UWW5_9BACT